MVIESTEEVSTEQERYSDEDRARAREWQEYYLSSPEGQNGQKVSRARELNNLPRALQLGGHPTFIQSAMLEDILRSEIENAPDEVSRQKAQADLVWTQQQKSINAKYDKANSFIVDQMKRHNITTQMAARFAELNGRLSRQEGDSQGSPGLLAKEHDFLINFDEKMNEILEEATRQGIAVETLTS